MFETATDGILFLALAWWNRQNVITHCGGTEPASCGFLYEGLGEQFHQRLRSWVFLAFDLSADMANLAVRQHDCSDW